MHFRMSLSIDEIPNDSADRTNVTTARVTTPGEGVVR